MTAADREAVIVRCASVFRESLEAEGYSDEYVSEWVDLFVAYNLGRASFTGGAA